MMKVLSLLVLLSGCDASSEADRRSGEENPPVDTLSLQSMLFAEPTERHVLADTVLLAMEDQRVMLLGDEPSGRLAWEHLVGEEWETRWNSRPLYGAMPNVTLVDLNGDGELELFWAVSFEEMVSGMVVVEHESVIRELIPDAVPCSAPSTVVIGGRVFISVPTPGAYTASQCEDPMRQACSEELPINWPRLYNLVDGELREARMPETFYQQLAKQYVEGAGRIERLLAGDSLLPGPSRVPSVLCGENLPQVLRQLADSATLMSKRR